MGVYSTILAIGAANGGVLAVLLCLAKGPRTANRILAGLILLLSLRLGPYIAGFSGAYDQYPELTFFPFDFSFAFGPLLWLYVEHLTRGHLPARWRWHFLPAAIVLAYWLVCFALPLGAKWDWYTGPHLQWIAPMGAGIAMVSAGAYLAAAARTVSDYRTWLDSSFANRDEARLRGLTILLIAFGVALGASAGVAIFSWWITPLDYFARFPLMVIFAVLVYALGLVGLRNTGVAFPHMSAPAEASGAEHAAPAPSAYEVQASDWRARIVSSGWYSNEALDLATLARQLATSERTLSRVLKEGAGQTFREFLGRIRVEAVSQALEDPSNNDAILKIAFDCGFNSKASFNRAFALHTGVAPSKWRADAVKRRLKSRQSVETAQSEAILPPA